MGNPAGNSDLRHEQITQKAYDLYLERGRVPGHEIEDWLAAEKIVDREIQGKKGAARAEPQREAPRPQAASTRESYSKSYSR